METLEAEALVAAFGVISIGMTLGFVAIGKAIRRINSRLETLEKNSDRTKAG